MGSCKDDDSDSTSIQPLVSLNLSKTHLTSLEQPTSDIQFPQQLTEAAKIEIEIVKAITSGKPESLKPNSGEAISFGENYVCVSCHEDPESDCRSWEWHGHVVSYSAARGYTQEYVHGSHFERMTKNVEVYDEIEDEESDQEMGIELGLSNLMDRRVFCRNFSHIYRRF